MKLSLGNRNTERVRVNSCPKVTCPKLKPSEMGDVSSLVTYLRNPQDATFFEALAGDLVNEVAENNKDTDSEDNSSDLE